MFYLAGVPIFYFPYANHPVERLARKSGFLLPTVGQSSVKGTILGDAFYWAISRSVDATVGAYLYSKRGWAQNVEFRARPSEESFISARYYGVNDRGIPAFRVVPGPAGSSITLPGKQAQGGQELRISAQGKLGDNIRGIADIDYVSSFLFRAAFAETYNEAINSEVISTAFLTDNFRGFSLTAMTSRYQNFQSVNSGDLITIVHAPGLELSSAERRIASSPFYWYLNVAAEGLSRREPNFVTADVVGRFDVYPRLSLPLLWRGWSLVPEAALRNTFYTDRLLPSTELGVLGRPGAAPVNRKAFDSSVELRPPEVARLFQRQVFGRTLKHTLEPRILYHYTRGVNFRSILRFDARDVLSDTNDVEYGITNRLYAKRMSHKPCSSAVAPAAAQASGEPPANPDPAALPVCEHSPAREVLSWEVAQKYFIDPTFGGALFTGRRNVFTSTVDFAGIAFLTEPRRFSPIISRLRIRGAQSDAEWHLDYDVNKGRISSSMAFLNHRFWKDLAIGGGHAYLQTPGEVLVSNATPSPLRFNQFRSLLSYGHPNKLGLNAAVTFGYDTFLDFLQYSAVQTSYNWDCCGFTFEYRRFALGPVRNENQFRFALTLTNVGTFGTLRKQERLY